MKPRMAILALPSIALAVLAADVTIPIQRQSLNAVTDEILFNPTLPQFTARRFKRDPSTLDWTSDGCTTSPDNPFRFPYLPACDRHDFAYQNYRKQTRFTKAAKSDIDLKFKNDLYYQCQGVFASRVCKALADVYYIAVRLFGGRDAMKREEQEELNHEYNEAVARYNQAVKEAQDEGLLPVLD